MIHTDVGTAVAEAREEAGITQKEMAQRLNVHQSQISRLEGGGGKAESKDFERYLQVLGSDRALKLTEILKVEWRQLSYPSLKHPNLEVLVEIEEALQRLQGFRESQSMPQVLAGQADLLFRRLVEFAEFLVSLDHKIAYIGDIGVGKTTALCRQANLTIEQGSASTLRGMMLDTGGGRTTLCDVYVQRGNGFAIDVEALPDEEVYRLVSELCRSIQVKDEDDGSVKPHVDYRPPEELERALRNMAGLTRPTRKKGEPLPVDPMAKVGAETPSFEEFKAEIASRLTLWRRTRRIIEFEGSDEAVGRQWMKETFTAINNGRHADFSLPERITITVPFSLVTGTPFNISLIDTRGVDGSAIRPDLISHLKNPRVVTVLCSKWGSAPDVSLQELLKHVTETEVDATLSSRVSVLVLARAGEGLSMRHESGDSVEDPHEGYEIKSGHVEDALERINMKGISLTVFDATYDKSSDLTKFLMSKIDGLRAARSDGARATIRAIDEMLRNVKEAEALATLDDVNKELCIFSNRHKSLKKGAKPTCQLLLQAIRLRHARSVWAATRRAGSFWNFNVYQYLGDGASADAKRRCGPVMDGLREIIENKLADESFRSAHSFLEQLLEDASGWEADFVKAARHHAVAIYKPPLSSADSLWDACEDMYGRGINGYRDAVAAKLESWFDNHDELQAEVERRVRRAWERSVLKPLRAAAGGMASAG